MLEYVFTDFSVLEFDFFLTHFEACLIVNVYVKLEIWFMLSREVLFLMAFLLPFSALNNPLLLVYVTLQSLLTSGLTSVFISSVPTTYTLHIGILMR